MLAEHTYCTKSHPLVCGWDVQNAGLAAGRVPGKQTTHHSSVDPPPAAQGLGETAETRVTSRALTCLLCLGAGPVGRCRARAAFPAVAAASRQLSKHRPTVSSTLLIKATFNRHHGAKPQTAALSPPSKFSHSRAETEQNLTLCSSALTHSYPLFP